MDGELNEAFVNALTSLDNKLRFLHKYHDTPAGRDVEPIAHKLKLKAIHRIRHFLLERFHSLKKPKTNIQIKQRQLLKFQYFYQFLLHHADSKINPEQDVAGEIRTQYHETMSKVSDASIMELNWRLHCCSSRFL